MRSPAKKKKSDTPSTRKDAIKSRSRLYIATRPCPHGHQSYRYTLSGRCVECTKIDAIKAAPKVRAKLKAHFKQSASRAKKA